jgi:hypothetical protein
MSVNSVTVPAVVVQAEPAEVQPTVQVPGVLIGQAGSASYSAGVGGVQQAVATMAVSTPVGKRRRYSRGGYAVGLARTGLANGGARPVLVAHVLCSAGEMQEPKNHTG